MKILNLEFEVKKSIEISTIQLENLFETFLKNRYDYDINVAVYLDNRDNAIVTTIINEFDIPEGIMDKLNDDFQTYIPPAFGNDMLAEIIPDMSTYLVSENLIKIYF